MPGIIIFINNFFNLLAVSVWIGSITFFSYGVAGPVFKNLASKNEAGKLNGIILKRLNKVEHLCIKIFIFTFIISYFTEDFQPALYFGRLIVFLIMAALTFTYSVYLTKNTDLLKEKIPDFDDPDKSTPERQEFDKYHKMYVKMMATNLLLGFVLLFISVSGLKM